MLAQAKTMQKTKSAMPGVEKNEIVCLLSLCDRYYRNR